MSTRKILVLDRSEILAEQLRVALADVSPKPDIVPCLRVGSVAEVLENEGPFDVLVAGPTLGTRSGLARLQLIREELPAMSLVLVFSRRPDASLRDIVRTGAVDMLQLPIHDKELAEAVERGLELAGTAPATDLVPLPAIGAPATVSGGPATVYSIASATGGSGKTFYATNLAYFLTRYTQKRVCIVDLDLQFGEVSTALRLRPKYTIFDALQREDTDAADLQAHIEEYCSQHETGVSVLAAPREPSEADRISPPDVTRILDAVRHRFDYVIVDTPPALNEVVLGAFDLSDHLIVLATLDVPSVRNMKVFLSTLERLKIASEGLHLVLNKAEKNVELTAADVVKALGRPWDLELPYDREVSRSVNLGLPVAEAAPSCQVSKRLIAGVGALVPGVEMTPVEEPADRSFLHRLLAAIRPSRGTFIYEEKMP